MGRPFAEGARLALTGVPNAIQDACRGVTAVEDVPSFKLPLMSSPAQSARETDDLVNQAGIGDAGKRGERSEEHTCELQARVELVCGLPRDETKSRDNGG